MAPNGCCVQSCESSEECLEVQHQILLLVLQVHGCARVHLALLRITQRTSTELPSSPNTIGSGGYICLDQPRGFNVVPFWVMTCFLLRDPTVLPQKTARLEPFGRMPWPRTETGPPPFRSILASSGRGPDLPNALNLRHVL